MQEILETHNRERAQYGLKPLQYNQQIAGVAQSWAEQLARTGMLQHRGAAERKSLNPISTSQPLGENLWMGTQGFYSKEDAVQDWIDEKEDYNFETMQGDPGKVVGHFTQVVWDDTEMVGCGWATGADGNEYLVCNYYPPGNFAGQTPF